MQLTKLKPVRGVCVAALAVALAMLDGCGGSGGGGVGGGAPALPPGGGGSGPDVSPDTFSFASVRDAQAGDEVLSAEITVMGIAAPVTIRVEGGEYRVDNGVFSAKPGLVGLGSRVQLRVIASAQAGRTVAARLTVGDVQAVFEVVTAGQLVANKRVPQDFPTLAAAAQSLQAGDVLDVSALASGQPYGPVKFTRAGTPALPIIVRGVRDANGKLPQIRGFDPGTASAVRFEGSHHMVFESFEVTNGSNADTNFNAAITAGANQCIFSQAHEVTIRNTRVFDCPNHGILGADDDSGSLTLDQVEVTTSGCHEAKGMTCADDDFKHPIYLATDPDVYPNAVVRIFNSYVHGNFAGEAIKTRAARAEIRGSWIESRNKMDHAIGLYGYDGPPTTVPIHHDVVGNVVIAAVGNAAMRFGGDGTGSSFGRTRLVNNTVLLGEHFGVQDTSRPVIRLAGDLQAFIAHNNIFQVSSAAAGRKLLLLRENDGLQWVNGVASVLLTNNYVPEGSDLLRARNPQNPQQIKNFNFTEPLPAGYESSAWVIGSTPGLDNDNTLTNPVLSLRSDSPLRQPAHLGTQDTNRASHSVPWALMQPTHDAVTATPGFIVPGAARVDFNKPPVLGAND